MDPSQQQLERIVAYLDGELSAEESAQVEQKLATDESFRQELQGAERAWHALDQLPMAHVGDHFSKTTMELVVAAAREDVEAKTLALPIQKRKRKTATLLLYTTAILLGVVAFRILWNNPNRRLVADLPVIHNIDIYTQFQSIGFLRDLDERLEAELEPTAAELQRLQDKQQEFHAVSASTGRKSWLSSLSNDQQVMLLANSIRFRNLAPDEQAKKRTLHETINTANDRDQLLQTMFRYSTWLGSLSPSEQYEIRKLQEAERIAHVARRMRQDANQQRLQLTPQQLADLRAAVQPLFKRVMLRTSAQQARPDRPRDQIEGRPDWRKVREVFRTFTSSPQLMDELRQTVSKALPADVRKEFDSLEPHEQGPVVVSWLWQARMQSTPGRRPGQPAREGEISQEALTEFFLEGLEIEERERLLALPREEMLQKLQRMYVHGQMPAARGRGRPRPEKRRPEVPRPPHDRRRREQFDEGRPGGPPRGPRHFLEDGRPDDRPPRRGRDYQRERGPRRPPPGEPPLEDQPRLEE